jgi:hypothetical protein
LPGTTDPARRQHPVEKIGVDGGITTDEPSGKIHAGGLWDVHEKQPTLFRERPQQVGSQIRPKLRTGKGCDKVCYRVILIVSKCTFKRVGRSAMNGMINLPRRHVRNTFILKKSSDTDVRAIKSE